MSSKSPTLLGKVKKLYPEIKAQKKINLRLKKSGKVNKVRKISPAKIEKLILEHRDHGKRLAWSFLTSWRIRLRNDDVISIVGAALCEAASRFDDTKGASFKTFFFYHLRGMLLKEIARMITDYKSFIHAPSADYSDIGSDQIGIEAYENYAVENDHPERILEKREVLRACSDACDKLDALEQEVIVRHFIYDEPLINIADDLDYCRCHISRVKSKGLLKLNKTLSKNKLFESEVKRAEQLGLSSEITRTSSARKLKQYKGGRGRRKELGVSDKVVKLRAISR